MPVNTFETSAQDGAVAKRLVDAFGELVLLAPISGVLYPLERVPDPVFSQKLAGDGISIDPTDNILRAPCPGEIVQQHAAGHAVTLKTAGDLEVLMHVGIDTVALKGKGFTPRRMPCKPSTRAGPYGRKRNAPD
jgi:glucose-specific phosphotransferase system IIA component